MEENKQQRKKELLKGNSYKNIYCAGAWWCTSHQRAINGKDVVLLRSGTIWLSPGAFKCDASSSGRHFDAKDSGRPDDHQQDDKAFSLSTSSLLLNNLSQFHLATSSTRQIWERKKRLQATLVRAGFAWPTFFWRGLHIISRTTSKSKRILPSPSILDKSFTSCVRWNIYSGKWPRCSVREPSAPVVRLEISRPITRLGSITYFLTRAKRSIYRSWQSPIKSLSFEQELCNIKCFCFTWIISRWIQEKKLPRNYEYAKKKKSYLRDSWERDTGRESLKPGLPKRLLSPILRRERKR